MKSKVLSIFMIGTMIGLGSCNLENEPENNYTTLQFSVCNLVMPANGDSYAEQGNYSFTYYYSNNTATVTTNNLSLGTGTYNFLTNPMTYDAQGYTDGMVYMEVIKFGPGSSTQSSNLNISDLSGFSSQVANVVRPDNTITGYPNIMSTPLVMQYKVNQGDFVVKTFMPDAIYDGTTNLWTQSTGTGFSNDASLYRVYFKSGLNKADVIFYNSKFASAMPVLTFALFNLDVTYTPNGYTITLPEGEKMTPQLYESGEFTPFPMYQFTSFILTNNSSNLTSAAITYNIDRIDVSTQQVADSFVGTFQGSYVYDAPVSGK